MRTIRNLAWFLLAFGLTVWAGFATAAAPVNRYYMTGMPGTFPSTVAMCNAWVVWETANQTRWNYEFEGQKPGFVTCLVKRIDRKNPAIFASGVEIQGLRKTWCEFEDKAPDTTKPLDQQCADKPDNDPPPGSCKPGEVVDVTYKIGPVGRPYGSGYYPYYPQQPHDGQCDLNCTDAPKSQVRQCFARGGDDFCSYTCERNGNPKSTNDDGNAPDGPQESTDPRKDVPPFESPNSACPKGTVNAGLSASGIPMCIGTGTDPKNKPPSPPKTESEKTETSADGTKTTTKTEITTNSDGSKTTTTTVTITKPDGTKQVDQQKDTSKTPSNAPGKDDSAKDDEKYDLCKQNPHLTICQNSSVAGKCGEISCTGDAIQCATLRAAAAMQCKQQQDADELAKSPLTGLGQQILGGADPAKSEIDSMLKGTEIDMSKPQLDASGFLGAGACFAPISVNVGGHTMTASFDYICDVIDPLRYLVLALAYVAAYLIVARSVTGGN